MAFEPSNDAARYINRKLVRLADRDLVTNRGLKSGSQRYFVSPARFRAYAADFFDDLKRRLDGTALPGLSYGTAGLCLGGDYSPQRSIDRTESRLLLQQALDGIGKDTSLLFDYGNTYILPYATGLLNAPLYDSQLIAEDETIPFFQMVVHGSIPYAGGAENLAADNREAYLRGIEYGAAPYAVFITREDSLLNHTKWQTTLFSVSSGTRLSGFAARIRETEAIRRETQNKRITAHTGCPTRCSARPMRAAYRVYVIMETKRPKSEGTAPSPPRGFCGGPARTGGVNMRILHNGGLLKHTAAARKARFGYLFILPFVLGLAVIFIPNIVQTFLYSISEIDPSAGFALNPKGFVFYRDALTVDPKFTRMLLTDLAGLLRTSLSF